MSNLPSSRLIPGPIWEHVTIDLFGPLTVRDSIKRRTSGKGWGIIFSCHSSRAVFLTLSENYGTASFLQALTRFINRNGCPAHLYSDRGSQLCGASTEISQFYKQLNDKDLMNFASSNGINWHFSPAKAPWYNAVAENLIKVMKKLLNMYISNHCK